MRHIWHYKLVRDHYKFALWGIIKAVTGEILEKLTGVISKTHVEGEHSIVKTMPNKNFSY